MLPPALLSHLLESAPDAMLIVDPAGGILFANAQVSALLGYERRELLGQPIEMLLPERFRKAHVAHRTRYGESPQLRPMGVNLELYALRNDQTEVPVEISLSPIRDGERLLIAAAIRDVTERKRIQIELVQAREAADRANQAKSRFLATASHDLRQPLQTLALLNGSLARIVQEVTAAEAVAQQTRAIEAMSKLLNALLDISKLESGAVRPDPTDFQVATLLEDLRSEFVGVAASKGLELRVESIAQYAHSDPSLVAQILRNLISNAIKYTQHGGVQLRCLAQERAVHVEVADTGIGIPADQLPYIYDEFFQVGGSNGAAREGYGLGLNIVHRLVTLLGLKLSVRSEPGRGSVFALDLPLGAHRAGAAPAASPAHSAPSSTASAAAPCVLLVDDDPGVRSATSMLLKVEGYRVVSAASLAESLQKIKENPAIDLLVTDYHLGGGESGLHVIAAARETLGAQLPAVLLTGDTSSSVRELEADRRLRLASKPIHADEFLGLLKSLLARN
jgi:PAS domain S-box-containing protein